MDAFRGVLAGGEHNRGLGGGEWEMSVHTTNRVCVCSLALLDMTINQFLKSVGLEHLREIFHREQVCVCVSKSPTSTIVYFI